MPPQLPKEAQRLAMRERPATRQVMHQRWGDLLFLHWPVDAAMIQRKLPEGLYIDTFDGRAWIGVVPFYMERIRPVGMPPVPGISWFLELNVRTYVHDSEGRPGVWFFSLDCNQPFAVGIARRLFHLPYQHAWMRAVRDGETIDYHSRRRSPGAKVAEFRYQRADKPEPASPGTLEWFLVERYVLFSTNRHGKLFYGQVHHPPYRIQQGTCEKWSAEPLLLNGFPDPGIEPPSILVAESLQVSVFPLVPLL